LAHYYSCPTQKLEEGRQAADQGRAARPVAQGVHGALEHGGPADEGAGQQKEGKEEEEGRQDQRQKAKKEHQVPGPSAPNPKFLSSFLLSFLSSLSGHTVAAIPRWKRSSRASWAARGRASRSRDTATLNPRVNPTASRGPVRTAHVPKTFCRTFSQQSKHPPPQTKGGTEFYAVKSAAEAKGEKRERVVSTLSEEDASSDDFDRDNVKRRRIKEENGKPFNGTDYTQIMNSLSI
jgi:hypothetical protein